MRLCCLLFLFASSLFAQDRIIPHLTAPDGGFATRLILENASADDRSYELTPYDVDGHALTTVSGSLSGRQSLTTSAAELLGADASHVVLSGADITVSAAYQAVAGSGSPAHVTETTDHASRHRLFVGDWATVFDGVAVVNTGNEAADVWVAQKADDGSIVAAARIAEQLPAMAKTLYILGSVNGSAFDPAAGANFEVYAAVPLAVTALRGNLPGSTLLWANPTRATGTSTSHRDEQGVWFVEGGSFYDAMEMMGYNVASDRLWQMETFRRLALGRLSEISLIANADTRSQDRFNRMVGYSDEEYGQAFDALAPDAKVAVKAYTEGINRRRAETMADAALMPIEFKALGIFLEPWREIDVLAVTVTLLRNFDSQDYGSGQLANAAILQHLQTNDAEQAAVMFNDMRWLNDPDAPTMIPSDDAVKMAAKAAPLVGDLRSDVNFAELYQRFEAREAAHERARKSLNAEPRMGSYAWVVAGDRTDTGNPILYSGPQMGLSTPSIVIEGSINTHDLKISGGTVPGIPGIIIGRTPHHAWSMQVGHADTMDLYMEPALTAENLHRIETFDDGGGSLEVYRTQHGPLISVDPPIAWKYAHWEFEFGTIQAFFDLARAQSMDEFGDAIAQVGVSQHFCYADRDGNIAYWMSGRNPVRPQGEYRLPQGAVPGAPILEYDIAVTHPLVHDRNTAQGFYGGWNNKSRADVPNSNVDLDRYFGPFHRSLEVERHVRDLVERGQVTFEEVRDVAVAISSTERHVSPKFTPPFFPFGPLSVGGGGGNPWPLLQDTFAAAVVANPTPEREAALALLQSWDGYFIEGGNAASLDAMDRQDGWMLMDAWVRRVLTHTFEEIEGAGDTNLINVLIHGLDAGTTLTNSYDWFTNADADAPQTRDDIIVSALDEALGLLGEQPWGVGARGEVAFSHPLLSLLTGEPLHTMPYSNRSTYAHCVEMGAQGQVRIESMFPLGESGNAYGDGFNFELDPHALDMTPFFDTFNHRVFPVFTDAKR